MNQGRGRFGPQPGLTGSPPRQPTKPNRLSRSYRPSQQTQTAAPVESPKSQRFEFKTPTRIPKARASGGFSEESLHNDSDVQHDIIWDATSPSPNRPGKRGKKHRVGLVDISEIVNRIAPKHGRPEVAEPTLQRWIGDSAAIPCTPDVQVPKPKKKSPRPNGVDDLLKLAKQFDFNMFRQHEDDEPEPEHEHEYEHSPELLPEDVEADAAAGTEALLDPHVDDDLDFLFDGPTQHVSGGLSQVSTQAKPTSAALTSSVVGTNTRGPLADVAFEDDWDDDFLDDSLVMEMTQNPQNFAAPKFCSTQRTFSPVPVSGRVGLQSAAEKHEVRQRTTFKLESNPNYSVAKDQKDSWKDSWDTKEAPQSRFPSGPSVLVKVGSRWSQQTSNTAKSEPQKLPSHQSTSLKPKTCASAASNASSSKTAQSFSSRHEEPADLLDDDDLLAVFSSDPVWDDPVDDDLLCEVCEDLENQIRNAETVPVKQTGGNQRAAPQPASRSPPASAGSSLAGGFVSGVAVRTTSAAGSVGGPCVQQSSTVKSAPPGNAHKGQFTFKKPNNPVSMVTSKVAATAAAAAAKCSAAEIELKKQQAIERRRQRLQAAQNVRAPT